jgi:hypothetical protein
VERQRDFAQQDGWFESPIALPEQAALGHVRWLLPPTDRARSALLAFGAWGEEGFAFRTAMLAPLVRRGLSVLLLELPLYGARRPVGRAAGLMPTVADFVRLGRGALAEARGLAAYLRRSGYEPAIYGFSMGGQLACMTAASLPFPVDLVSVAPSSNPAPVFLDGPIGNAVAWDVLEQQAAPARVHLRSIMERISVLALPRPADPARAHLVGTRHDRIVPPGEVARIAAYWAHANVSWLNAGHVSAVTLQRAAIRRVIARATDLTR